MTRTGIIGIYLAAGQSKRFGSNKLLPPVGNVPLGSLALNTALNSRLDRIVVVTGGSDKLDWISPTLFHSFQKSWFQAACVESPKGQAYSLKCGLRFAESLQAEAIIVMLADQALVSVDMIDNIIEKYLQMKANQDSISFIAARRSRITCPPILFARSLFEDLYSLEGDMGARYLIRNRMREGSFIDFTDPLLFFDVDTEKDYNRLLRKTNEP